MQNSIFGRCRSARGHMELHGSTGRSGAAGGIRGRGTAGRGHSARGPKAEPRTAPEPRPPGTPAGRVAHEHPAAPSGTHPHERRRCPGDAHTDPARTPHGPKRTQTDPNGPKRTQTDPNGPKGTQNEKKLSKYFGISNFLSTFAAWTQCAAARNCQIFGCLSRLRPT